MQKEGYETIYLAKEDVATVGIDPARALRIARDVYLAKFQNSVQYPPNATITLNDRDYSIAQPAWVTNQEYFGAIWQNVRHANYKKGFPTANGLVILNRRLTGAPLAILEGTYISQAAIGAAAGLCASLLAPESCHAVGLLGGSEQGIRCLKAVAASISGIKEISVYDAQDIAVDSIDGLAVNRTAAENVIKDADILILAEAQGPDTQLREIVQEGWLKKGCLILSAAGDSQLSSTVIEREIDACVIDDLQKYHALSHLLHGSYPQGFTALERIVAGETALRTDGKQTIFCCLLGLNICDIALAYDLYQRAKKENVGVTLEIF